MELLNFNYFVQKHMVFKQGLMSDNLILFIAYYFMLIGWGHRAPVFHTIGFKCNYNKN